MKVSGFTFIRNAVQYDYPIVEAILSILPLCDELVVCVGNSSDETEALIRSINSDRIRIVHSVWDDSLKEGGRVLAVETDKALDNVAPDSDWCVYIQGDEVIHEKYHDTIRKAMYEYKDDKRVEGLLFKYLHFYGSYDFVGDSRRWYSHEIRVIRNLKAIRSYRDAQGFRLNDRKLNVKEIDAYVYHYGWVRHPEQQMNKILGFEKLYNVDTEAKALSNNLKKEFNYLGIESLARFQGTHPLVMKDRIARKNWNFEFDTSRKNFSIKGRLLHWIENLTGKRFFDYQNYKIIK